ncbi:DnaB-like helicase C-terminal domain-containing protein [Nonomuraea wenchangensis]
MTIGEDFKLEGWEPNAGVVASEMAVAGAVIQSRQAFDEADELVAADDFFSVAGMVFAAACKVIAGERPLDPAGVLNELSASGDLEKVGGGAYLATLMEHAAPVASVAWHARKVAGDGRRRRIHLALSRARGVTESQAWDPEADIDLIRKMIDEAAADRNAYQEVELVDAVNELLDELEDPPASVGVVPPYLDLERDAIPAFKPGQLVVVAARPSVGKTLVAADIARTAALRDGKRTVLFTLEMSKKEILGRIFAAEATVLYSKIVDRKVTPEELEKITQASWRVTSSPLIIEDSPHCTVDHVRSRLRTLARTGPIDIVIIDYLQLLEPPAKIEIRQEQVAAQSRALKQMARDFGVPIIVLAQLNRGAAQKADAVPRMSEIRESGAVEQDADIVILLHRPDFYEPECPRAGEVDLIVDKNRAGRRGVVTLAHQLHYSRFADLARPVHY